MDITVKIKRLREVPLPEYATDGAAAVDLRAALEPGQVVELLPGQLAKIPTGLAIAPETFGVVAILASRSGLSTKHGIRLANGIGVIDADYRGEICVSLQNAGNKPFSVTAGDRIAQLFFLPVLHARFLPCDDLDDTVRGAGGFGSTGVQ